MDPLNIKVGDKVIYNTLCTKRIATVTKITPTGRIRIDCSSSQFDKYGSEMGPSIWNHSHISEYDEEKGKEIMDQQYINYAIKLMREVHVKDITIDTAMKIIGILGKGNSI